MLLLNGCDLYDLGMGLPTTASYIIAASVGVPAMIKLGVTPLAAHLFVFYFACISAITPPVCVAVYTACGFSKTDVWSTGWIATRLGISAYIAPFIFVYHPVLLMKGSAFDIVYQFVMACIGVAAVSMAVIGTAYYGKIRWNPTLPIILFGVFLRFHHPLPGTGYVCRPWGFAWHSCHSGGLARGDRSYSPPINSPQYGRRSRLRSEGDKE